MERLPELVLDKICEFLNVKDIGACCSTGTSLRNVFNQDHVWRRFCDQLLASHLKVTECKVKPRFVSPEPEDSSLSPICDWRLSYMREVHLWNNWRRNRFTFEYFGSIHGRVTFMEFVNNNLVIMKLHNNRKIMLWDVTGTPVFLSCPATLMSHENIDLCEIHDDGKIIFLQFSIIQIFSMDSPTSDTWRNLGVYHLSPLGEYHLTIGSFVADNKVIAVRDDGFVEVFDLKSCKTLVMSDLPEHTNDYMMDVRVRDISHSGKLSNYFAVILLEYHQPRGEPAKGITVLVYNIEEVRFLQFKICIPLLEYNPLSYHFAISDHFLAVFHASLCFLTIYNYLTSEVIYRTAEANHTDVEGTISVGANSLLAMRFSKIYRPNKEDICKKTPTLFLANPNPCINEVAVSCQVLNCKEKNLNELIQAKVKDIENMDIMVVIHNSDLIVNKVHTKVLALDSPEVVLYW